MKRTVTGVAGLLGVGMLAFVLACGGGGGGGGGGDGGGGGGGGGALGNKGGGATGCGYQTYQLTGCFHNSTSGSLDYYCFDGAGSWRKDLYVSGPGCGTVESGQYGVQDCTLTVCDQSGCDDYEVQAVQGGMTVGGVFYEESNGC